jgi:hypothetical protein
MSKDRNEMQELNETLKGREKNEKMGVAQALNRYGFVFLEPRFRTLDQLLDSFISPDNDNPPPAQLDPLEREEMINTHMVRQHNLINRNRQQKARERAEMEQSIDGSTSTPAARSCSIKSTTS